MGNYEGDIRRRMAAPIPTIPQQVMDAKGRVCPIKSFSKKLLIYFVV